MIDLRHGVEGGAAVGADQRFQRGGAMIEILRTVDLIVHHPAEAVVGLAGAEGFVINAGGVKFAAGDVDSAEGGIFAQIAEDVGELKRDAAVDRQGFGCLAAFESPDKNAGDADDAGDAIAIFAQLVEGLDDGGFEVVALAGDDVTEDVMGHAVGLDHLDKRGPEKMSIRRIAGRKG